MTKKGNRDKAVRKSDQKGYLFYSFICNVHIVGAHFKPQGRKIHKRCEGSFLIVCQKNSGLFHLPDHRRIEEVVPVTAREFVSVCSNHYFQHKEGSFFL